LENTPPHPHPRGGGILADIILGKKCEKRKRKWRKMQKMKEERRKKNEKKKNMKMRSNEKGQVKAK
jgi:hypothetical protein